MGYQFACPSPYLIQLLLPFILWQPAHQNDELKQNLFDCNGRVSRYRFIIFS